MVDGYLSVKFGVNPLDGFWENDVYGRTDDGRPRHDSSSDVQWYKAELKMKRYKHRCTLDPAFGHSAPMKTVPRIGPPMPPKIL